MFIVLQFSFNFDVVMREGKHSIYLLHNLDQKTPLQKFSLQHSVYFLYIALAGVIISAHTPLLFYFIFFTFNYTWMLSKEARITCSLFLIEGAR